MHETWLLRAAVSLKISDNKFHMWIGWREKERRIITGANVLPFLRNFFFQFCSCLCCSQATALAMSKGKKKRIRKSKMYTETSIRHELKKSRGDNYHENQRVRHKRQSKRLFVISSLSSSFPFREIARSHKLQPDGSLFSSHNSCGHYGQPNKWVPFYIN